MDSLAIEASLRRLNYLAETYAGAVKNGDVERVFLEESLGEQFRSGIDIYGDVLNWVYRARSSLCGAVAASGSFVSPSWPELVCSTFLKACVEVRLIEILIDRRDRDQDDALAQAGCSLLLKRLACGVEESWRGFNAQVALAHAINDVRRTGVLPPESAESQEAASGRKKLTCKKLREIFDCSQEKLLSMIDGGTIDAEKVSNQTYWVSDDSLPSGWNQV